MKWLITLLFFTTTLFSQNLSRTISDITYRTQLGTTIGLIELSDGSTWKWISDCYSENYLRKWAPGDRIIIRIVNHPGFCMQNLDKPHYNPMVSLSFDSYLLFPAIKNYDKEGFIILSDGSKWELLYDFNKRTLFHWAIGDRIICVKGIHNNFEIINIDIPHENRCQIERSIEVLPFDPNRPRMQQEG